MNTKRLVKIAIVSAIYVALTILFAPISFGAIQFRISEILILLCFFKKDYIVSLIIGCLIANLFSLELGYYDLIFGVLHTAISSILVSHSKHLLVACVWPVIFMPLIALELWLVLEYEFFTTILMLVLSEMVVVFFIGYPLFRTLSRNERFIEMINK